MMIARDFRRGRSPGDPAPFLARSRLFRETGPEIQAQLARFAQRVVAARGNVVVRPGEPPGGVFIVAEGYVALSVHEDREREKVVEICGPGESFGEDCLMSATCAFTARVVSAGLLVHLPQQAVLEAMDRHPGVARAILRSVSRKILQATQQIGGSATRSGLQRLAGYLLRHLGADERAPAKIVLAVPKRVAASLLGLSKETFSRLLAVLAARGLVEIKGRTIGIPSPEALVELCHEGAGCASCGGCPRGDGWMP
jgi:CRP-like cAMP-binding protein